MNLSRILRKVVAEMEITPKFLPEGWSQGRAMQFSAPKYFSIMRDTDLSREEREAMGKELGILAEIDYPNFEGQAGVVIFSDGSLYHWDNGGGEAWAFASDFISERAGSDPEYVAAIEAALA